MNVEISVKIKRGTFVASKFIDSLLVPPASGIVDRVHRRSQRKRPELSVFVSVCSVFQRWGTKK